VRGLSGDWQSYRNVLAADVVRQSKGFIRNNCRDSKDGERELVVVYDRLFPQWHMFVLMELKIESVPNVQLFSKV
jgi:hypothetical protein